MTGRRLLDAAALLKATRGVASKHLDYRKHQLDAYSKTSILAKTVLSQTDRVTLTVRALSALAKRFEGPGSQYSTRASQSTSTTNQEPSPDLEKAGEVGSSESAPEKQGPTRDHLNERLPQETTAELSSEGILDTKQKEASRNPLRDGSSPPAGAPPPSSEVDRDVYSKVSTTEPAKEPLEKEKQLPDKNLQPSSSGRTSILKPLKSTRQPSAEQARKLQRQAEKQIPSQAAESPTTAAPDGENAVGTNGQSSRTDVLEEQGVFYTPSSSSSRVLSNLPRVKLPKNTVNVQKSDGNVPYDQINQEVFYSSTPSTEQQVIPETQAIPEQEPLSEESYSEIFHSPRAAKLLKKQPVNDSSSQGLELPGARNTLAQNTKSPTEKDQVSFAVRTYVQSRPDVLETTDQTSKGAANSRDNDEDVRALATDIAEDVEPMPSADPKEVRDSEGSQVSYEMRESRVPSSRIGRIWQYGGLAASMTFGAVGESFRRATGGSGGMGGSLMLSASNMDRLVAKLSRMRGAALKLGQMMSFQDSKMLPGPIHQVLQRVQDSADFMPASQRNAVLASNLGADWRELFSSFEEKPIAAASIGQVHSATLKESNQRVAVKVQYPGVANSIDSDLSNLSILLTASRLLPKGLYLDKTIANARTELAWECDYIREAEMGSRFRNLLADETATYHVPAIIPSASSPQVLTAEFCSGIGVTKAQNCTQAQKDWIGSNILRLCLREITEFKFMQTDPNWTNFLFNAATNKLELLDFGASRDFPDKFIKPYIRTLLAASRSDRATVRDLSIQLGYLTGHESRAMRNAHVESVLTLAEPFMETAPEVYDFRDQTITDRVRGFIPVMVRERLAPPPEETYSLHRKLSGAFLLCARLGSRIRCREMFANAIGKAGVV